MLSVLFAARFAFAGDLASSDEADYNSCMVGLLVDWEQNQALAFPVDEHYGMDMKGGVPLTLEPFCANAAQSARLPFNTVFVAVILLGNQKSVYGLFEDDDEFSVLQSTPYDVGETTTAWDVNGLEVIGNFYVLDAGSNCSR